jgi:hypothetical protein
MKAKPHWITNINAERKAKVEPLYAELRVTQTDDSMAPTPEVIAFRQRHERELRAQIAGVNETHARRIKEAASEAAQEHYLRLATGTPYKPEQVAQAQMVAQQYQGRPPRHLVDAIQQALNAGDPTGARVKALAAETLNVQLGALGAQLLDADPIRKEAKDAIEAIEGLAELALNEPLRELGADFSRAAHARDHDQLAGVAANRA